MSAMFTAFARALRDILSPRMLLLAVWPLLAAFALWLGLAWWYWADWARLVGGWVGGSILADWLSAAGVLDLVHHAAWLLLLLLLLPAVLATAGVLAAALVMPMIVGFVAARDYPALEQRRGGSIAGSFLHALIAIAIFVALWIAALPLWLAGVAGAATVMLLSAWLVQRLFRYDALAEHADADEYRAIVRACRGRFFLLGLLVVLLYALPIANLLAPVFGGLMFTHFALAQLAALRQSGSGIQQK